MFKKTNINSQLSIFSSAESNLKGTAKRFYNNVNSWHNVFRNQVYSRIDESIFSVLYSGGMGAPNASIRTMISMMIIKEGHGYSDDELFEDCHFNSLTRAALGLFNNDDTIPTKSTYYSFRKRVAEYDQSTGENLIETAFASITKGQDSTLKNKKMFSCKYFILHPKKCGILHTFFVCINIYSLYIYNNDKTITPKQSPYRYNH